MQLAIIPHNDDESLFLAYTLMREKPLVVIVTDSAIQPLRGDRGCDAETRWKESVEACKILGCPVMRLGINDNNLTEELVEIGLKRLSGFDKVYIPAIQGGNWQHDLISKVARKVFPNVIEYTTYTKEELWTKGTKEVVPTVKEMELKNKALDCYKSQLALASTAPHFVAVRNKSEWLN